jgi:putative colanic acid biosynthesis UDP-glucose lipid carrier transferase
MKIDQRPLMPLIRQMLNPSVAVLTLAAVAYYYDTPFEGKLFALGVFVFLLVGEVLGEVDLSSNLLEFWSRSVSGVFLRWLLVPTFIVLIGYSAKLTDEFSREILLAWFVIAPFVIVLSQFVVRSMIYRLSLAEGMLNSAVIVGVNHISLRLASKFSEQPVLGISCQGFFDDRNHGRLKNKRDLLGNVDSVAAYVKENQINQVYIAIPMSAQSRIMKLMRELSDTTASIYFIPDVFLFDLIQARIGAIQGIPVITVRETPFLGVNGLLKRLSDIVLALLILVLISPFLILIALGIKLTSKGPVLFKQRRYGLDGEEITVYKFRSMTVQEDGLAVVQATRNDARVTGFGGFLRRTSLDELPQFINVLQGRMSIVGPRPHAVAHNEFYRNKISGYMVRHKVKPGITGWAQVNGCRGETDAIEKMEARINYDIEYLRNWSLMFDILIILRTIKVVIKDKHAY